MVLSDPTVRSNTSVERFTNPPHHHHHSFRCVHSAAGLEHCCVAGRRVVGGVTTSPVLLLSEHSRTGPRDTYCVPDTHTQVQIQDRWRPLLTVTQDPFSLLDLVCPSLSSLLTVCAVFVWQ